MDFDVGEFEAKGSGGHTIEVKLMLRKSTNTILFALCEEAFADFILSFLTFPLGAVEHMLKGNCFGGSIDNLYKSMLDLDPHRYFRSPDLKDKLVKSLLAHQFKLRNHILPIDEVAASDYFNYYCFSKNEHSSTGDVYYDNSTVNFTGYLTAFPKYNHTSKYFTYTNGDICAAPLSYLEPQSSSGEAYSQCDGRGFIKRPSSLYMVTDDLVVTPSSSVSTISFLTKLRIPLSDLEERVISIGKTEVSLSLSH